MFERFTEKAVNVVSKAQEIARTMHSSKVLSEHLLLALSAEARGVSLKIFKMYGITYENLYDAISKVIEIKPANSDEDVPSFSHHVKILLKDTLDLAVKSGNPTILYEHLFLAVINDKHSNNVITLEKLGFDVPTARALLEKLVQKKTKNCITLSLMIVLSRIQTEVQKQILCFTIMKSLKRSLNVRLQNYQLQIMRYWVQSRYFHLF